MKKKTYIITISSHMEKLLYELNCCGVKKSLYQVEGNTIITKDNNVVDVVTETFHPDLYKIEVKQ